MTHPSFVLPLPLNRPEYVAVPEAFISALATRRFQIASLLPDAIRPLGLYFEGPHPISKSLQFVSTRPQDDAVPVFARALEAAGLKSEGSSLEVAEAVLNSILGIKVERSQIHPASPLSPSVAMLQNTRGLLRKGNPADIAQILEGMYQMGSARDVAERGSSAAGRWHQASVRRLEIDPLLRAIDSALDSAVLRGKEDRSVASDSRAIHLSGQFDQSPFGWFAESWDRLTEPVWVDALPARVWVDWATTILRLAYGFGFLWEASWYVALARDVQSPTPSTWLELQSQVGDVIPWVSSRAGTTARDVAPRLIGRIHQGERVRRLLARYGDNLSPMADFDEYISVIRADQSRRDELRDAVNSSDRESSGNNLWEATKYALLARGTSDSNPDYYGVLHANGRYLTVSPGTEWVAVVASLTCVVPGGSTDVGRVLDSLGRLGMRPELSDLIALLERAGLARGSADADRGVQVESAF